MEVEVGGNRSVDLAGTSLLVVGQMSFTVLGSLANNIVLITVKVWPVMLVTKVVNEPSRSFIVPGEGLYHSIKLGHLIPVWLGVLRLLIMFKHQFA